MLSAAHLESFERDGAVTIDGPFSEGGIDQLNAAFDRIFPEQRDGWISEGRLDLCQPEIVDALQDPFWEELSCRVLHASEVELATTCFRKTVPKPDVCFALEDEHVDFRCTREDLRSEPRPMLCGCLLWLTPVTRENFPLYYRPGSHIQVSHYSEEHPEEDTHRTHQVPPPLEYAAPVPILAQRGQVSILSGPLVHAGSVAMSRRERRVLFVEYKPKGSRFPYYVDDDPEKRDRFFETLKPLFRPERRHVLPG